MSRYDIHNAEAKILRRLEGSQDRDLHLMDGV